MKLQNEIFCLAKEKDTITKASPKVINKQAMYYKKLDNNYVNCQLCFRRCKIAPNRRGFCTTRENRDGILYSLVYSQPCAVNIDPIEKEPVFHAYPGCEILCIATAGCSMRCNFCHNWQISQQKPEEVNSIYLQPDEFVKLAKQHKCEGISFTYSEPTVFYEYMLDICKLAKQQNILTVVHTCGIINPEPLNELLRYVDSITVDLKGFNQKFYSKAVAQEITLSHILNTIKIIKESGKHLEIVNLVIPKLNDNFEDIKKMCLWIKQNLGCDVPLHFNRFSPAYKLTNLPTTPLETLEEAHKIAKETGLNYVFIGNVPGHKYNSTYCPNCKKQLIHRIHFQILENNIVNGCCKFCNYKIPGIWEER
ncbi:MAG: AmmeMemoRadiSam system radical SAM enzyme [Elusimicrobiota bacterium]